MKINPNAKRTATKRSGAARGPMAQPKATLKRVADVLSGVFSEIFALDDFSRRYKETPFTHITMREATNALTLEIANELLTAEAELPSGHPALHELETAREALSQLDEIMLVVDDGDGDISVSPDTLGATMRTFVVKAAQAIERAQQACGGRGICWSYLDNPDHDPNRLEEVGVEVEHVDAEARAT